ncbi:pectate lyase [Streptomyces sp. A7024]|uniref:Pectate lyase n=1 Tax=Streptomyces coryli TaxID=1128680 RepID=A0A6G4U453_9ACTN|nr:pectate lyase [Streptomyces coryli]NGN67019.1 pectate lyase [Streptomyces coryli]
MRCHERVIVGVTCCAAVAALTATTAAADVEDRGRDVARQTLAPGDGWGASGPGVTGGAKADAAHVHTVRNREELAAALRDGGDTPKIIKIKGVIDANTDAAGKPLTCDDYATDGYTREGYLEAYDPATWGKEMPSGPMEDARLASAAKQAERVKLAVGSNTTIIGAGSGAKLLGATLSVRDAHNVIVRNLTFEDAFDCFPQWDGTKEGEWNSEYDQLVIDGATHVWVDHNTFTDGRRPDSSLPTYFGALYQQHDGELDIVRGANLVTASWNSFEDHDKTLLFGNSDSAAATDAGKLKITLHHNRFSGIVERAPRVRFGQVDVYNNHFEITPEQKFGYVFGIGHESRLYAEKNAFTLPAGTGAGQILKKWKDAPVTAEHNYVNGKRVDLIAAHNAQYPEELLRSGAGWTPELRDRVDHPRTLPGLLDARAGAGRLR